MRNTVREALRVIAKFYRKVSYDRVDAYAANSAFFIILGFIPFVMVALIVLQYTPLQEEDMVALLGSMVPDTLEDYMVDLVGSVYTGNTALLSGTAIAAIWACSRSVMALANGLNVVYDTRRRINYVFARIRAAFGILLLLLALLLTVVLFLLGSSIHDLFLSVFPWLRSFSWIVIGARTAATVLLLALLFCAMYTFLPYERQKFTKQIPGAIAAAFAWSLFSSGFSVYFQHSMGGSSIYGSLTLIAMVMLWLYFCMWILFAGSEINCYLASPGKFEVESPPDRSRKAGRRTSP